MYDKTRMSRWLSIARCLKCLLYNWDALKIYFNKANGKYSTKSGDKGQNKPGEKSNEKVRTKSTSKSGETEPQESYAQKKNLIF